ncbi:hypothetical protein PT974_01657 [Cladobotryum mycophilum]|uniref:Uncharacterized protein n=1 Tax=Cladobotryum mycophilum TaxID=491253 RepID=A0ABR0T4K6_9HYPO
MSDILACVNEETITPAHGAMKAHQMRNQLFTRMRAKTSPIGLLLVRSVHPGISSYHYYLDKNARSKYKKAFKDLTQEEAREVSLYTIDSAGRAGSFVTRVARGAGLTAKAVLVVGLAVLCLVSRNANWASLGQDILCWASSIFTGQLCAQIITSTGGPIGAILGSIAGSVLGSFMSILLLSYHHESAKA